MTWMLLSICSAAFLGFYEIAKKASLKENAVPPVLFFNVLTAATLWTPLILLSQFYPDGIPTGFLRVEALTGTGHFLLFLKSLIAGSSWIFASFALKHLPMSIAAPIRASSPFWTITIAVLFLSERPDLWQWVGISIILISFYVFSLVGRKEGIHFHRNRWVGFMVIATLLGACSALYDKYLLQTCQMHAATVQAWFSVYLVLVMTPLVTHWYLKGRVATPFHWRWSIPMIAVLLLISDFLYFTAIETPGGLISVISPLRRTSIVIAFIAGIKIYGEKNPIPKGICIMSMLVGVYILSLSRG
jgi:drug/metabolite transporter (DMT)-like permease